MGMVHGPNMVTDDLIFMLDVGNVQSYPGSGSYVYDLVGTNTGTIVSSPVYSSNNGGYLTFDGVDDYINYHPASIITPVTTYTIHIWIRVDHTNATERIYSQFNTSYTIGVPIVTMLSDGRWVVNEFRLNANAYNNNHFWYGPSSGAGVSVADVWQCITFCRTGTGINNNAAVLYHNGASVTFSTYGSTGSFGTGSTQATSIGYGDGNYADADIAMVLVYNKALTAAEVLQNYNAHKSRFGL